MFFKDNDYIRIGFYEKETKKIQAESQHHCDSDWNDNTCMMQTNMAMLLLQQRFS